MSGIPAAAMFLAVAVLLCGGRPRRRIAMPVSQRRGIAGVAASAAAVAVIVAAVVLPPAVLLAGGVMAAAIAGRLRRGLRDRRRLAEGRAMAAALEVLIGELRVGANPTSAFTTAAAEATGPVKVSLQAVASRAQLGAEVSEGIGEAARTSPVPAYWNRLGVCWELAAQHGLAISVLMRTAHRDIVDRQRFADRTHAAMAGARATAAILASLPALGILLGQLIGAHPVRFLLGGGAGGAMLVAGITLVAAGLAWADRIIEGLAA